MPLSITTAGREAAGSMRKRENIAMLVVVDGNIEILAVGSGPATEIRKKVQGRGSWSSRALG